METHNYIRFQLCSLFYHVIEAATVHKPLIFIVKDADKIIWSQQHYLLFTALKCELLWSYVRTTTLSLVAGEWKRPPTTTVNEKEGTVPQNVTRGSQRASSRRGSVLLFIHFTDVDILVKVADRQTDQTAGWQTDKQADMQAVWHR